MSLACGLQPLFVSVPTHFGCRRVFIQRRRKYAHTAKAAAPSNEGAAGDQFVTKQLSNRRVIVTGATGLIGRALVSKLTEANAHVTVLARDPPRARGVLYDGRGPLLSILQYDAAEASPLHSKVRNAIASADAVVNLAGEPVEQGRWTDERKKQLWDSRVAGTEKLVATITETSSSAVLVSASAVGYYGPSQTMMFTESSRPGTDYLARLAVAWERSAARNNDNSRTVILRFGVVLGLNGGALPKMTAAFKAFLGGPPGTGQQWFSWVHIDDVVRLIQRAIVMDSMQGVYNCTSPKPVRLEEFCAELGRALNRPSWLPVPSIAIKTLLGNEAAQLILAGQAVLPKRTIDDGFKFRYTRVSAALHHLYREQESNFVKL